LFSIFQNLLLQGAALLMGCSGSCCGSVRVEIAPLIPICVLGLPGVGKTSIVESLGGDYNSHDPPTETCGVLQRCIDINGNSYLIYDVCGYMPHSDEWLECLANCVAVMIVVDPVMLHDAGSHLQRFFDIVGPVIIERNLPTLTLVNKCDATVDLSALELLLKAKLGKVPSKLATISHLNQALLNEFAWIESFVV
jgi:GTPase SAR1 family protein